MAEDQGREGDRWTHGASRLLTKAGWQKFADSNIDIDDVSGKPGGIDALFHYEDGFYSAMNQGVFLEAKHYATTSVNKAVLQDWITTLSEKIERLRYSQKFITTYPIVDSLKMTNGVIAVWFHDTENYPNFRRNLFKYLMNVKVPIGRREHNTNLRIFLLENDRILRLASLLSTVETWNSENVVDGKGILNFHYPSSVGMGNPGHEINVINLEYIYSQFVLARSRAENSPEVTDIVFYFGELNIDSFTRLRNALHAFDMVNAQNNLVIYKYNREAAKFSKIEPDVLKMFDAKDVKIKDMTRLSDLPTWMIQDE